MNIVNAKKLSSIRDRNNRSLSIISEDLDDIKWLKSLEWLTKIQQAKLKILMNKYSTEEIEKYKLFGLTS